MERGTAATQPPSSGGGRDRWTPPTGQPAPSWAVSGRPSQPVWRSLRGSRLLIQNADAAPVARPCRRTRLAGGGGRERDCPWPERRATHAQAGLAAARVVEHVEHQDRLTCGGEG